MVVKILKYFAA